MLIILKMDYHKQKRKRSAYEHDTNEVIKCTECSDILIEVRKWQLPMEQDRHVEGLFNVCPACIRLNALQLLGNEVCRRTLQCSEATHNVRKSRRI